MVWASLGVQVIHMPCTFGGDERFLIMSFFYTRMNERLTQTDYYCVIYLSSQLRSSYDNTVLCTIDFSRFSE